MPHRLNVLVPPHLAGEAAVPPPSGPGFSSERIAAAARMEVWGSSFADPGEDWCEFRLLDAAGVLIATRRVSGY